MTEQFRYTVLSLLEKLPTRKLDALKQLFWSEFNYEQINQSLSVRDWPEEIRGLLIGEPVLFAGAGEDNGFHVIFCQLCKSFLSFVEERILVSKLTITHPYALYIFADKDLTNWHFVNVKYDRKEDSKAKYILRRISVGPLERLRTAAERLSLIDIANLSPDLIGISPLVIQNRHNEAFDVEKVTKDFFSTYHIIFESVEDSIIGLQGDSLRLFTQKLFNRLLFVMFIERKGWLSYKSRHDYLMSLWEDYKTNKQNVSNFYNDKLKLLFFAGLNTSNEINIVGINEKGFLQKIIGQVPYLNGGLFEEEDVDSNASILVPDKAIESILTNLLYRFNFTVTESTPLDVEVAVDPEMLGKIFEELVTGRHETGSYYTPKPIVSFMCQEALKGYLKNRCPGEKSDSIDIFVTERDATQLRNPEYVLDQLKKVRVCDPACGSGAYLLGILHELIELRQALFISQNLDSSTMYDRKLEIIRENLYGVDIDPFAINIARLRLWLSLIVDFSGSVPLPLPNLDFKIEVGDSLSAPDPSGGIQPDMFRQHQIDSLLELKNKFIQAHGSEKILLRNTIKQQKEVISSWINPVNHTAGFDWAVEFLEIFTGNHVGFDIVVTNPPYVRQELITEIKPILSKIYPSVYSGRADLYVYFYSRAIQLLKDKGMLAFISSNKWLRAQYGVGLRKELFKKTNIFIIIDFGELPVFETAATFPMVFIVRKEIGNKSRTTFAQVKSLLSPYPDMQLVVEKYGHLLPENAIKNEVWLLGDDASISRVNNMGKSGIPLSQYVGGEIFAGIKTGLNKAFWLNEDQYREIVRKSPELLGIIKPLLVGNDIRKWRINNSRTWLIYTPPGIDMSRFPEVINHLSNWREKLENRALNQLWYELQQAQYRYSRFFEKPKIVYPDISMEPRFTIDYEGYYIDMTAFAIPSNDLYLLGILNSSFIWEFLKQRASVLGDANQRGRLRLKTQYMKELPIPQANPSEKNHIIDLVQKCLDIVHNREDKLNIEAEIDDRVSFLYSQRTDLDLIKKKDEISRLERLQKTQEELDNFLQDHKSNEK